MLFSGSMGSHSDASFLSRLRRSRKFCGLRKTMLLDDLELERLQSIYNIKIVSTNLN